jgi:hypothetical protein
LYHFHIADDAKAIAAIIDLHAQALLDLAQMFVELATEVGQPLVIGGFH